MSLDITKTALVSKQEHPRKIELPDVSMALETLAKTYLGSPTALSPKTFGETPLANPWAQALMTAALRRSYGYGTYVFIQDVLGAFGIFTEYRALQRRIDRTNRKFPGSDAAVAMQKHMLRKNQGALVSHLITLADSMLDMPVLQKLAAKRIRSQSEPGSVENAISPAKTQRVRTLPRTKEEAEILALLDNEQFVRQLHATLEHFDFQEVEKRMGVPARRFSAYMKKRSLENGKPFEKNDFLEELRERFPGIGS